MKAGKVEPEETAVSRQRLRKQLSTVTDSHATTELTEAEFSTGSVPRLYKWTNSASHGGNYSRDTNPSSRQKGCYIRTITAGLS
jgi:hypothetical protein